MSGPDQVVPLHPLPDMCTRMISFPGILAAHLPCLSISGIRCNASGVSSGSQKFPCFFWTAQVLESTAEKLHHRARSGQRGDVIGRTVPERAWVFTLHMMMYRPMMVSDLAPSQPQGATCAVPAPAIGEQRTLSPDTVSSVALQVPSMVATEKVRMSSLQNPRTPKRAFLWGSLSCSRDGDGADILARREEIVSGVMGCPILEEGLEAGGPSAWSGG